MPKIKINLISLFIGGIAAGITVLIVGAGLVPILGNQMNELLQSRLLPPLSKEAMIFFAFCSLIFGFSVTCFYALFRTKFRSRAGAIITVALVFWFFVYFLSNAALVAYGFMPFHLVVTGTAWGLLELVSATLVGSFFYIKAGEEEIST
jgi:hypothetical protein